MHRADTIQFNGGTLPKTVLFTFVICMSFLPTVRPENNTKGHYNLPFNYDPFSSLGPSQWHQINVTGNEWERFVGQELIDLDIYGNECSSTRRPSPVNLVANGICVDNHEMLTRKIRDHDCNFDDLTFSITPHSLRASFPVDDTQCLRPTIDLPNGYPYRWHAHFIEIHIRAEHVLDGRRYDGELQMAHLGQEDQKRELSIVSVMLDSSAEEDDSKLQQYIDEWQKIANVTKESCHRRRRNEDIGEKRGSTPRVKKKITKLRGGHSRPIAVEKILEGFHGYSTGTKPLHASDDPEHREGENGRNLQEEEDFILAPRRKMFPYNIWPTIYFYRYRGSITYPPCSEIVSWRILDEPLLISRGQFKQLARLLVSHMNEDTCEHNSSASPTGETYRPLQQLNHKYQELTHCTANDFNFWMYPPHQV